MQSNGMTRSEVADNWDLSIDAIEEIDRYCTLNHGLIRMEADEERLFLQSNGVAVHS